MPVKVMSVLGVGRKVSICHYEKGSDMTYNRTTQMNFKQNQIWRCKKAWIITFFT